MYCAAAVVVVVACGTSVVEGMPAVAGSSAEVESRADAAAEWSPLEDSPVEGSLCRCRWS